MQQKSRDSPKIIIKTIRVMEVKIMGIYSLVESSESELRPRIENASLSELECQDEFIDAWLEDEDTDKEERDFILHAKDKGYSIYGFKEDWQVIALVAVDE